jgi:hypothetical protein
MVHDMGDFGWGMGFGWIFMILFWGLLIVGIVAIVKWVTGSACANNAPPPRFVTTHYSSFGVQTYTKI